MDSLSQAKEALESQLTSNTALVDELRASLDLANAGLEELKAKVRTHLLLVPEIPN